MVKVIRILLLKKYTFQLSRDFTFVELSVTKIS